MEKKNYSKVSVSLIKFETSNMICGSGGSTGQLGKGDTESGNKPTPGSDGNIYGESRSNSGTAFYWE